MYGKLENGTLVFAPNPVVLDGVQIFNPAAEVWESMGYLPVAQTKQPEDGAVYDCHYEQRDGQLVQCWTAAETVPPAALLAVLMGEEAG